MNVRFRPADDDAAPPPRRRAFRLVAVVFALPVLLSAADSWTPGDGWILRWADEFSGTAVDPTKWTYDLGAGGWGNNELQTYTTANATVTDGELVIEARRAADGSYSSARLKTQGRAAWRYGKFAARIRLPAGQGIWPAFWMLGDNITTVGWPKCGEIDIVEMIGGGENRDDSLYGTLHWDANNAHANYGSPAKELPDPQILHDDYHVFEVEWNASAIVWRLDGAEYFRTSVDTALWPTMDEFHRDFFLILNLAVGGNWPGYPDASTVFPQQMRVDWVRVYQAADPVAPPVVSVPPTSTRATVGASAQFAVTAGGAGSLTYQWRRNGAAVPGATSPTLTLANVQPADAGVYTVAVTNANGTTVSAGAILGLESTAKIVGSGNQVLFDVTHPNGNVYDQVVLTGPAVSLTSDPAQVTRVSFIDLSDDIVQVEFSGAGTLTLTLDHATGPAVPVNYNQALDYMKGHATLTISGADSTTNISAFTVGTGTAVNQTLFKPGVAYDGVADLALLNIVSATGQFGGIRMANTEFFATRGLTGVNAPGVAIAAVVNVHNIDAHDDATPALLTGSIGAGRIGIAGGNMKQANARAIQVGDASAVHMLGGETSHRVTQPAQANQGVYERNGVNVTATLVVNP